MDDCVFFCKTVKGMAPDEAMNALW